MWGVAPGRRCASAALARARCYSASMCPIPFHVTRPFYLDAQRPDLATLYLQSSSGGVYGGDDLSLTLDIAGRRCRPGHHAGGDDRA